MSDWTPTTEQMPPEGVEVNTLSPGGLEQTLVWGSGLWWFPDRSMYVYYSPAYWREV